MVTVGDTLTIPCIVGGQTINHPHIVMTDPHTIILGDMEVEGVILVNVSSKHKGVYFDPACQLTKGEHELVVHDSWIVYDRARVMRTSEIQDGLTKGSFKQFGKASVPMMSKIKMGMNKSKHIKRNIQTIYNNAVRARKA